MAIFKDFFNLKLFKKLFSWQKFKGMFLLTVLFGSSSFAYALEQGEVPAVVVATHFYKFNKSLLEIPGGSTFISKVGESKILALGIENRDNFKTAVNAKYPISLLDIDNQVTINLKDLDLRSYALSGARILDFEFIGLNKLDFNALVSFSRNHGIAPLYCRDMLVLGLQLSFDPTIEHQVVREVFETGCVPSNQSDGKILGTFLEQSGGQIAFEGARNKESQSEIELFVTVGDFGILSKNKYLLAQKGIDSGKVLGSIIKIKVSDKAQKKKKVYPPVLKSEVITTKCASGIRNSQGLSLVTSASGPNFAATSHGPRGGDTLMMFDCKKLVDYGWPDYSLGTSYDGKLKTISNSIRNEGSVKLTALPNWTWTPSIGPSALIQISSKGKFSRWWNDTMNKSQDVLVSGMGAKKLFRVRSYDGRVVGVEEIVIGERCRSLVEMNSGSILCGLDSNQLLLLKLDTEWNSNTGMFSK